jgi:hypothetical protein
MLCEAYTNGAAFSDTTDVVLIVDSCYSGDAMRGSALGRSVEIIAAVGAEQKAFGNPSELARVKRRTFTSRLVDEVAIRIGRGEMSVSFAEIVGVLRSVSNPDRLPEYHLRTGRVGIRVPILGEAALSAGVVSERRKVSLSESSTFSPSPPTPEYAAVFTVHLSDTNPESVETKKLVNWIHSLDKSIGLEITGVYKARSTAILFHAPWHLWAQLSAVPGCSLVCETFGRNRLPELLSHPEHQQGTQHHHQERRLDRKENLPFRSHTSTSGEQKTGWHPR